MPNSIKYSVSAQTLALKKGNFWIGTGDVEKGPTSSTDYWSGIAPPASGYTIYLNKASQGPSIYQASNDSELIGLTNGIAEQSFTSVTECFNWYNTQSDKMVFNIDYPTIVTSGLVLNLDAGFRPSYSTSGTTWNDTSPSGNNGTLTNGPTYSSTDGGSIVFDGTDDYVLGQQNSAFPIGTQPVTVDLWIYNQDTGTKSIFSYGKNLVAQRFDIGTRTGNWIVFAINGGAYGFSESSNLNNWMNLTVIPGTLLSQTKIYKNGVQKSLTLQAGSDLTRNTASNNIYVVGALVNSTGLSIESGFNFTGKISVVKLYNRELSAEEVLQNYNAQKSRFGL